MRIVLYTKSNDKKDLVNQVISEQLNKEAFDDWGNFEKYINTLKVPCQILLDKDSVDDNLYNFVDQYSFHHIICLTSKPCFNDAIGLIKHGSLLATWNDLWNMNWWWNRSLINFERVASDRLNEKSIILSPYSFSTKVNHILHGALWKTLFDIQPLMIKFDGRNSFSRIHLELENFKDIVFRNGDKVPFPIIAQFDFLSELSPYGFKEFMKNFTEFFHEAENVKLFLLSDDSQYAFDKILIPCFENEEYELYKMNLYNIEKLFSDQKSLSQVTLEPEILQKEIVFEHIKIQQRSYQS